MVAKLQNTRTLENSRNMFNVFKELLQLPIELISRFVLSKLSWKDLSALDIAISNKNKRGQYCDWMNLYCCDYELRMTTSHCFLKWLKLRKVCIKSLSIERSMDNTVLHLFSQMGLKVDSICLVFCEFLSADAISDFLDSVECRSSILFTRATVWAQRSPGKLCWKETQR